MRRSYWARWTLSAAAALGFVTAEAGPAPQAQSAARSAAPAASPAAAATAASTEWTAVSSAALEPLNEPARSGPAFPAPSGRGSTVVVLWASWCDYCKRELRGLDSFAKSERARSVRVVGISVDDASEPAQKAARKVSGPVALFHDSNGTLKRAFSPPKLPMTIVFDAKGAVFAAYTGMTNERLGLIEKSALAAARDGDEAD